MCRALGLLLAVVSLAACTVSQSPLNPAFSTPQPAIEPNARGKSGALLYAAAEQYVELYTFPSGRYRTTFSVNGRVNGMCSDSSGDVFLVAAPERSSKGAGGYVFEFAHAGKTPVATLNLPKNAIPIACSVDPTTDNLAVTAQNSRDFAPSVAIYAKASGTPKIYKSPALGADPQAAYDASGKLFATSGGDLGAELNAGARAFKTIRLNQTLGNAGHVQWDGSNFAIQSFAVLKHNGEKIFERVYRLRISGSSGRVVSLSRFDGWTKAAPGQSWIEGSTIVATPFSDIVFWNYPGGGKPTKVIRSAHRAKAVTVSVGE